MRSFLVVLGSLALGACGGGDDDGGAQPDAASPDAAVDAVVVDAPQCAPEVIYLNFEGQAVTQGANSAALNTSSVVDHPSTVPAYLPGNPNREAKKTIVIDLVRERLEPLGYSIVTERPAAGLYDMIVVGGLFSDVVTGGSNSVGAVAPTNCSGPPDGIAFVFSATNDPTGSRPYNDANVIVGMIGVLEGVPTSAVAEDCMCIAGANCAATGPCVVGGAGTARATDSSCGSGATFDERAAFDAVCR